jgi:hypothetical protein
MNARLVRSEMLLLGKRMPAAFSPGCENGDLSPAMDGMRPRRERVLLGEYSLLGGYHTRVETRGVRIGQIRRFLVWLIEHFPSAAGILSIFLD